MMSASTGRTLARFLAGAGSGPVFVHADAFRAASLVERSRDRKAYLASHVTLLREAAGDRPLWIPVFNYAFPRSREFSVRESASELGPLTEHFRTETAEWRTPIPIFSVSGTGPEPSVMWGEAVDPFGQDSVFARLVEEDGVILYYGDTFHSNTILHYAEQRVGGGPPYRYDKVFPGTVIMPDGSDVSGSLRYHVRPLGTGLDYDWPRILEGALEAGVCRRLEGHPELLVSSARDLTRAWEHELRRDPLAFLDEKSRRWVEPALEQAGRRFQIGDFESPSLATAGRLQ